MIWKLLIVPGLIALALFYWWVGGGFRKWRIEYELKYGDRRDRTKDEWQDLLKEYVELGGDPEKFVDLHEYMKPEDD